MSPPLPRLSHRTLLLSCIAATALIPATLHADPLEEGFRNPPQQARPQVWWHWMAGNVSAEGARLDLEWMQRVGIGGVHAFAGGGTLEKPYVENPLPFMSPGWRDAYRQSVAQARAQGMDVTIAGSPGWSQTGGPWVEPAQAMKKYVWSEVQVEGGRPVGQLPQPPQTVGHFQARPRAKGFGPILKWPETYGDSAVFAFRTPGEETLLRPRYTANGGAPIALDTARGDLSAAVPLAVPPGDAKPHVDMDFGQPQLVQALTIAADPWPAFEILASDDGRTFRSIRHVAADNSELPAPQHSFALPPTRTRWLRVQFDRPELAPLMPGRPIPATPRPPITAIALYRLEASAAQRVDQFEAKAGFQTVSDFAVPLVAASAPSSAVDQSSVVDLTGRMKPDGTLDWVPPKGRWTVVRLGWSLTGQTNNPAEPSATGLEVDKYDAAAVADYAAKLFALYEKDAGVPLGPKGIGSLLTDSWEAGPQNWTPAILADFTRLRGYDPRPWLPVLTGRIVGNAQASDAFLYDFQRTLKDLVATNHYGVMARAAHDRGMTYYTEAQGDSPRMTGDGLTDKAQADIPTAEYWYRRFATDPGQPPLVADLEEAASAAHLYGKPLVAAESMTVAAGQDPWAFSPAMLKPVADTIFAHGVNRILIHESHHQPYVDRKPGLSLGFFGQFFNRNDTWAEDARPWTDYLAATSFLLQQGRAVADVAYVYGEDKSLTQRYDHDFNRDVPRGYAKDYVDPSGLLTVLNVRDGRIVTDSGMSYRVLYLPAYVDRLTLESVRRIEQLVRDGAVLVARKPVGGLGLLSSEAVMRPAIEAVWGDGSAAARTLGKGRVYATADLAAALRAEGVAPDVDAPTDWDILTQHRRTDAGDEIYFLSSQSDRPAKGTVRFRATGTPQLWTADDGRIRPLPFRRSAEGVTDVDLSLDPKGAAFVIFRPSAVRSLTLAPPAPALNIPVVGPWKVTFEAGRGAPASATFATLTDWSRHDDPGIRYFSGGATYSRTITIDPALVKAGRRLMLDLGAVHELAVVSVDGKTVATAWKPPYRIDLTGKVGPGRHALQVRVVNLWPNRLIGDQQPGAKPVTWAPQYPYKPDTPLLPSGLLGPVQLVSEAEPVAK